MPSSKRKITDGSEICTTTERKYPIYDEPPEVNNKKWEESFDISMTPPEREVPTPKWRRLLCPVYAVPPEVHDTGNSFTRLNG